MNKFYAELEKIKQDPQHWYIYSSNAYEFSQEQENPGKLLQELVSELEKIGIKLGWQGFDAWDRYVYNDYYGTAYYPSEKSLDFVRRKKEQQRRVEKQILSKMKVARQHYDHYDQICKTSHQPTLSREKRNYWYERLSDLSRWSSRAFNQLTRYRRDFEVEFSKLEK